MNTKHFQTLRHYVDVAGARLHEVATHGVALCGMISDDLGNRSKVARSRRGHPSYNGMGIGFEPLEQGPQQPGPRYEAVPRPEHAAQSFTSKPCAAALVGNRKSPATDPMLFSSKHCPSDASRADYDDPPIATLMRAHARRVRVIGEHGPKEGVRMGHRARELQRFAGACKSQACDSPPWTREPCLLETLTGSLADGTETHVQAEPEVRGTCLTLPKYLSQMVSETRAAVSSATIYAKEQQIMSHCAAYVLYCSNAQNRKRICNVLYLGG